MSLSSACSVCARVGSKSSTCEFSGRKHTRNRQIRTSAVECAPHSAPFAGEWVGLSASFSPKGQAIQVPDSYVPREYAEWGIEIKDWASVSSLNVKGEEHAAVLLLTKFMLPTVGCEADAASFVEDRRVYSSSAANSSADVEVFSHSGPVGILHTSSTHEHFIGYPETLPDSGKAVLDFSVEAQADIRCATFSAPVVQVHSPARHTSCKAHRGCSGGKPNTGRSRVRLHLNKWSEGSPWSLQKIDLFREAYSGVYTGGRELPMSCGAEPGFSRDTVPESQSIRALRVASDSQAALQTAWCWQEGADVVHLPLGVSLRVATAEETVSVEVVVLPNSESPASQEADESPVVRRRGPVLAQVAYEAGKATNVGIEAAPVFQ